MLKLCHLKWVCKDVLWHECIVAMYTTTALIYRDYYVINFSVCYIFKRLLYILRKHNTSYYLLSVDFYIGYSH